MLESPLWILPLPAGTPRRLGDAVGHGASWSLDQQHIAYARGTDLYVAKSDGADARKLATVPGVLSWPRWSPNGKSVRFTVADPSDAGWLEQAGGRVLRQLDRGRELLHFPVHAKWRREHLGHQRRTRRPSEA